MTRQFVVAFAVKVQGNLSKDGCAVRVLKVAAAALDDVTDEGIVIADKITAQSREAPLKGRAEAVERINRRSGLIVGHV